jgi:two-component system chemotaxis sensor kinase CheA
VLKPAGGDDYALSVDVVHDHEELVVKPAAPAVMAAGLYAGTTLADDGSPILLLDPSGVAAYAGVVLDENGVEKLGATQVRAEVERERAPALLFMTLDGAKRAVRLSIVERIEDVSADSVKFSAGQLRIALGERILPLAGCGTKVPEGKLRILRLSDGEGELAYGFAEVIDLVSIGDDVMPAGTPGEIGGVTLINGEQVEVIDSYWLFGEAREVKGTDQLVCALSEDPWMENILRPLIEAAGYRTVKAGEVPAESVDLFITNAEAEALPEAPSGAVIKIRAKKTRKGKKDDSIYRYDREGLLEALNERAVAKGRR